VSSDSCSAPWTQRRRRGRRREARETPTDSTTGMDRLSALPNDILAKILFSVSTTDSVRNCAPCPLICTFPSSKSQPVGSQQVPLRHLSWATAIAKGGLPKSLATWLPATVHRVSSPNSKSPYQSQPPPIPLRRRLPWWGCSRRRWSHRPR